MALFNENIKAERAVLGAILLGADITIAKHLKTEDFFDDQNRIVFKAMLEMSEKAEPIDLVTLEAYIKGIGHLNSIGGALTLTSLTAEANKDNLTAEANKDNLTAYVKIVKDEAIKRAIIDFTTKKTIDLRHAPQNSDTNAVISDYRAFIEGLALSPMLAVPSTPLGDYLKAKHERDSNRDPNKPLGYALTKFKTLEHNIDGIQTGFYIIGADTNTGKTAFLTNLFLDLLDTNKETKGLYFSLDDNKDIIINRFIAIKTSLRLNQIQKKTGDSTHAKKITDAYSYLFNLYKDGRLDIKDIAEINHIDILEKDIKERADKSLFVFIDGLYNLDVGGKFSGLREENIDRANKVKALVDTYKIPIITTGELRKRQRGEGKNTKPDTNDLMETGKFAYNANLVLLLSPTDIEEFKTLDEPILRIDYAKNKLSHYKGYQEVTFIRPQGIIEERELTGFNTVSNIINKAER